MNSGWDKSNLKTRPRDKCTQCICPDGIGGRNCEEVECNTNKYFASKYYFFRYYFEVFNESRINFKILFPYFSIDYSLKNLIFDLFKKPLGVIFGLFKIRVKIA